jgi:adenylate cyclase
MMRLTALSILHRRLRGTSHRLRLWTGLILFAFAATHLLNHALGLVSFEAMQTVQVWRTAITQSQVGNVVLISAALTHFCLGVAKFLRMRTWHMGLRSGVQLGFGLLIPVLLIRHVIGTTVPQDQFGIQVDYAFALWAMWPGEALNQALLITLVWVHGCIGLHHWLAAKPIYRRAIGLWYALAVLIPTLGYLGFAFAARLRASEASYKNPFTTAQYQLITDMIGEGKLIYAAILAAALGIWLALLFADRFRARVKISYAEGMTVSATKGQTLLEISRANRIPHASVCGGRARCSTCRVRVTKGLEDQPAASEAEERVLRRVGAPANVRLACQLRPSADLSIAQLLPGNFGSEVEMQADKYHWGVESHVTLLFCDLRGFTQMSERLLSYDVVFLLNQFLGRMAAAIEDTGGHVDKFMGDGIMAIFGMDTTPEEGARQAIAAARAMGGDLESLNQSLREDIPRPLAMGIGIHTGTAILGRVGARSKTGQIAPLTALGETVNLASRLESKTKELSVQAIVSAQTMALSGLLLDPSNPVVQIHVNGHSALIEVYAIQRALDLPS